MARMWLGGWVGLVLCVGVLGVARPALPAEAPGGAVTVQAVTAASGRLSVQTTIDKRFVSKGYMLKNAGSSEIEPIVTRLLSPEQGVANAVSIDGLELLVVSVPTYMLPGLDATVASLDVKGASIAANGQDEVYYRPKHRLPGELAQLSSEAGASASATVVPDDANNLIYISDTPDSLKDVIAAFENFDAPESQAEIEVRIVEISEENSARIGFLWDAWKRALPESVDVSYTRERSNSAADGFARSTSWGVDFSMLSPQALADFVNYMTRHGAAETKTTTRLHCVHRQTAAVNAGDVHRFFTSAQPGRDCPAKNLVDSVFTGLSVKVTPFIGSESIKLRVEAEVSSLSGFDPNGLPAVNTRTLDATAVLRDGQTFALTGLERQAQVKQKDRVFLLGHIPLLGDWLFTAHSNVTHKSQLIVLLTPRPPRPQGAEAAVPPKHGAAKK